MYFEGLFFFRTYRRPAPDAAFVARGLAGRGVVQGLRHAGLARAQAAAGFPPHPAQHAVAHVVFVDRPVAAAADTKDNKCAVVAAGVKRKKTRKRTKRAKTQL